MSNIVSYVYGIGFIIGSALGGGAWIIGMTISQLLNLFRKDVK